MIKDHVVMMQFGNRKCYYHRNGIFSTFGRAAKFTEDKAREIASELDEGNRWKVSAIMMNVEKIIDNILESDVKKATTHAMDIMVQIKPIFTATKKLNYTADSLVGQFEYDDGKIYQIEIKEVR